MLKKLGWTLYGVFLFACMIVMVSSVVATSYHGQQKSEQEAKESREKAYRQGYDDGKRDGLRSDWSND